MSTEGNQRPARRDPSRLVDAAGFRAFVQSGWDDPVREPRLPAGAAQAAADHRRRLSEQVPGRRVVVAAGRAPVRSNDTDYAFRPDSDFSWLTGCDAEGAVLVMHPVPGGHEAELYLRAPAGPKEVDFFANARDGQLWIGAVPDLDAWSRVLGMPCRDLEGLPAALRGRHPAIMATRGADPLVDALLEVESAGSLRTTLAELRAIKDDWEIGQLRAAVDATVVGFGEVAAALPAAIRGGGERWLQGTFDRRARTSGNGPGYATIVAAGEHAPVLHWVRCDGAVPEDGLVLLDAGVEVNTLYTADVTRTFPASGEFSPAQRQVYDLVHRAHLAAMAEVRPGQDYGAFHRTAMAVLAQGLHDWGLLPVSVDEALESDNQHHRRYIVCGVGHFLGLDVHDCASARASAYHEAVLAPGMTLTVEPGLYFHATDQTVPPELRGIGVRIEDDLVVTATGADVLSADLPIDADGIERWVASQR
ncbi:aminopeptidase P family protein [Goodfellowiella coeruleoviolacea]|uniref:Xaa-Pro aminopeptidase n=1 Tax=Goodfellowiella coeruleoviolacea TaxID=334858 RepID=A0AAE3GHF0_9PSEU|nr:aminopeptidase P family protein [Goodfellowiella coeruleoviolacea]MCP2168301.1 Xaa-Pro aminopeptidase [Goodfellowiella coeruleoviolacea]